MTPNTQELISSLLTDYFHKNKNEWEYCNRIQAISTAKELGLKDVANELELFNI